MTTIVKKKQRHLDTFSLGSLNKLFRLVGLDVRLRKNVVAAYQRGWEERWAESFKFLASHEIRTILDIGANTGQFAKMIRRVCPDLAALHSFEPLEDCQPNLTEALVGFGGHHVHQIGLGEKEEEVVFNHCEFSPCSSLLRPNERLIKDHPGAGKIRQERISVRRLDDWAADYELLTPLMIKIDVQGFETKVMAGGRATLSRAQVIVVETAFCSLYEEQPSFHEIYSFLRHLGFAFRGTAGQNICKNDFQILEADAIFEKDGAVAATKELY